MKALIGLPLTEAEKQRRNDAAQATKPPAKLGAEKLTPEEQRRRFEELAREAGCDEGSEARFEAAIRRIGQTPRSEEKDHS